MCLPFLKNEIHDGEEYSSPSLLDIFKWILYQVPNEKYFVGSPNDLLSRVTGDMSLPSGTIIMNKHIFKAIRKTNKITKNGKLNYSRYFKYAGIIEVDKKIYHIVFTKKVIKSNMFFYYSGDPFSIWIKKDKLKTVYNVKKLNQGCMKKCQIKIWP